VHLFRAKKYGIWGDFFDKFQVLCKNPDEVTRFDAIAQNLCLVSVPEVGAEFAGSGAPREGGGAGATMGVLRAHQKYVVGVRPAGQRSHLCHLVLYTLIKKKIKFFSYIRKFIMERSRKVIYD
jgi:hypothetical protein